MKLLYRMAVPIFALAVYFPSIAVAQACPDKPVRVIVVFPPGGSNDMVARIVFQKMSEMLGEQFVIENRGGAAGTIGSEVVANSAADGYTIMVQSATHVANPQLYKQLPYDALKDFTGITPLARQVGTPKPIVDRLNAELKKAFADPGVASKLSAQTLDPMHMTPEQFEERLKSDDDKYQKVIKLSGARIG